MLLRTGIDERLAAWRQAQVDAILAGAISPEKLNCDLTALRAFYAALKIEPNPAMAVAMVRQKDRQPRPLSAAVMQRLLDTPACLRDRVFIECMYPHGMRIAEVCGLRTPQLEVMDDRIHVHVYGKGRKVGVLPFRSETSERLAELVMREHWPTDSGESWLTMLAGRLTLGADFPVFVYHGRQLSPREGNLVFRDHVQRSGLKGRIVPHQLRHTTLTRMAERDVPILKMMAVSRHADPKTLMRYVKVAGAAQAIDALDDL